MALSHRRLFDITLIALATVATGRAETGKPAWIEARPAAAGYIVGIGFVSTRAIEQDEAHNRALAAALSDIASQVEVQVASVANLDLHETGAGLKTDFVRTVRAASTTSLEGIEIVATWQGEDRYWLYARVSRERLEALRRARAAHAAARMEQLWQRLHAPGSTPSQALAAGVEALALTATLDEAATRLSPVHRGSVLDALGETLTRLELQPASEAVADQAPVLLAVLARDSSGQPAVGLPVRFRSHDPRLDLEVTVRTDASGRAAAAVSDLRGSRTVTATVDLAALLEAPATADLVSGLGQLAVPTVTWRLHLPRAAARLTGVEPWLRPTLAAILASHGMDVVSAPDTADLHIDVRIDTTVGRQVAGVCFTFVAIAVTVEDRAGRRLYSHAAPRVKGAGTSCAEAVKAALRNPCTRLDEAAMSGRRVRIGVAPLRRVHSSHLVRVEPSGHAPADNGRM